jgi:hypothetical protein
MSSFLTPKIPSFRRTAALVVSMFVLMAGIGCRAPFPAERVPRMQWLILPPVVPPAMRETPTAIQGWWLGARTIRQNPNAGEEVVQIWARRLAALGFVDLYSPVDLRYYFADKRQALQTAYPRLTRTEIDKLLDAVPKVKFGKELGADRVLTGRINALYMADNRTIHWWWSVADITLQAYDVATDKLVWECHYHERQQFATQEDVLAAIMDRAIVDMKREVFLPLTR